MIKVLFEYFEPSLIEISPDASIQRSAWFDFEDIPLKWHWSLGTLYDYQTAGVRLQRASNELVTWNITIHFTDYPYDELGRDSSTEIALRDYLTNSVKEVYTVYLIRYIYIYIF